MNCYINIKEHSILISSDEDELINRLISEFHFFTSLESAYPQFEVHLHLKAPPQIPPMIAHKILSHALIYQTTGNRYIDYGRALIHQQGKIYSLYTDDEEFLFELSFLCIHSLLGDLLEDLNLFRIHALAGTYREKDFILMLPSGGGKSSMLKEFLADPLFSIISDDSPLVDIWGKIHPFPTKISLSSIPGQGILKDLPWTHFYRSQHPPKFVLSLSQLSSRINHSPQDQTPLLLWGQRSSFHLPQLFPMCKWDTFKALLENMVIGIGLPQVIEIFLRFKLIPDSYKMISSFSKRSFAACALFNRSKHYRIVLSRDIVANCQRIKDLIDENHSK